MLTNVLFFFQLSDLVVAEKKGLLVVDEILELLKNGDWHGLSELADKSGVGERRVGLVVDFLCGFDFLVCDKEARRVRLSPELLAFLRKVEVLEREDVRGGKKSGGLVAFLRVVGSGLARG